ncbi:integrase domain-containing protein [Ferribacterium limneticum]|uniref:integrase domain-containing protein n=1 Tax=Ferribacterium limneticum TaxID=76259 RepID=UPI001CFA11A1|nr:integrase domain-containing protein [Ferribacterium limneticum]UCV17717.1 integrase domain-containing protein [Ferribacterium limneticum]
MSTSTFTNTSRLRRRVQGATGSGPTTHQPARRQEWASLSPAEILAHYRPGKADPLQVLNVLLELFNTQHTALDKTVSHKTRQERADFLRRFFRDLKLKANFATMPDPRNLGDRHIRAIVAVWREEKLAPSTIQTYLSFLRGLALWIGKPGFIHPPAYYGLTLREYQRDENAQRDKSWTAAGIDIDTVIEQTIAFDRYVGASLGLIRVFGLRRKEAVMLRPHLSTVPFETTGLPPEEREADHYLRIKAGAKGGRLRFVPLDTEQRIAALKFAQAVVQGVDSHLGDPRHSLKRNLRRFDYVMDKFGITADGLGATAHGLRHEAMIDHYTNKAGGEPPVRGGGDVPRAEDATARLSAARLAGHNRARASGAYLGGLLARKAVPSAQLQTEAPDTSGDEDFLEGR